MEKKSKVVWWRDERFWKIVVQGVAVVGAIALITFLLVNLNHNLRQLNLQFGFDFLQSRASFDIGETPIDYDASNTYARALVVGLLNSLRVAVATLVLTTMIGIGVGIARLSSNWLVRKLALVYVEALRNTPLLLQLLFWYLAVFTKVGRELVRLPGNIYLTNSGLSLPWIGTKSGTGFWFVVLLLGIILAAWVWRWRTRMMLERGQRGRQGLWTLGVILGAIVLATLITGGFPLLLNLPEVVNETQLVGGLRLSPEYAALVVGLTLYTAAFIAEIVRAGIQAVPKGQVEAAKALGLNPGLAMRLVIFPQALRIIIPPLNSQYLNLWKNSSLAIAIGYPDIYAVASTTFSQTSKAVEVMLLIMLTYLGISLVISLGMNTFNRLMQFR
jgi:general L-amino acid transport system permease protein